MNETDTAEEKARCETEPPLTAERAPARPALEPHRTAPVRQDRQALLRAKVCQRGQQIARWSGVIYNSSVRVAAFSWHYLKQWQLTLRKELETARSSTWLSRHSELVLPAGALMVITLSASALAFYLGGETHEHNTLFLAEPGFVIGLPDTPSPPPITEDTKPATASLAKPKKPSLAKLDGHASSDTDRLARTHQQATLETGSAGTAPDPVPTGDNSVTPEPARRVQVQDSLTSVTVASDKPPVADAPTPADSGSPQDSEERTAVALTALEPQTVVKPVQPVPPPDTVDVKIARLMVRAQASLKNDRLLFPEENSAYRYYQQILTLDPGNADALRGMDRIIQRYLALADLAVARQDLEKARRYVSRGLRVQADDQRLAALQDSLHEPPVSIAIEPPPMPVEAQPLPANQPEPPADTVFSRIRTFFKSGHATVGKDSIWEEDNTGY